MANVVKVAIVWTVGPEGSEEEVVCAIHVKAADGHDPFTGDDEAAIAAAIDLWWNEPGPYDAGGAIYGAKALYHPSVRLDRVETERWEPTLGTKSEWPMEGAAGVAIGFDVGGNGRRVWPFPSQLCWLVGLRTDVDTRSGRGRLFLPATDIEDYTIAGSTKDESVGIGRIPEPIIPAIAIEVANLAHDIRWSSGTEAEFVWAVYSRLNHTSEAVLHFEVCEFLRTQRRRQVEPGTSIGYGLDATPL